MKNDKKVLLIFFFNFLLALDAHAYKYVIITDQADPKKSEEVVELFKNTYPFNTFNIEFEILKVDPVVLNCGSSSLAERLVQCENVQEIENLAQARGADQAMVVKEFSIHGGSSSVGGGVPVITTFTSARYMLHEYLHTLGMCDEYKFDKSEANIYCKDAASVPNLAYIIPKESYSGDPDARSKHFLQIPWYGAISSKTLITNSNEKVLGTGLVDPKYIASVNNTTLPTQLAGQVGLFRADVCDDANPPIPTWQPEGAVTIMARGDAGLGAYSEKIVEQILLKKGVKKKLDNTASHETGLIVAATVEEVSTVNTDPVNADMVNAVPSEVVNNSGRGLSKSFFSWIGDLIQQIGNAMTR